MPSRFIVLLIAATLHPSARASTPSDWQLTPSGAFQYDLTDYRLGDDLKGDAHGARRSRIGLRARHASGLELRAEWDFASGTATDLFAELPLGPGRLRMGQYKQPFSLEEQGSSRQLVLPERSLAHDASSLGRRAGLMWTQPLGPLQVQASAFAGTAEQLSGGTGLALRFAQLGRSDRHLGIAFAYQQTDDDRLRLRARPESRLLPLTPLDLGSFSDVGSNLRMGAEGALLRGSWTLQAEAFALQGQARSGGDPSGQGGYLQASWFSGERARSLHLGALRAPRIEVGQRAWELAARVARVDFDLGRAHLGAQSQLGVGATLHVGPHWQFMLEHSEFRANRALLASRAGDYSGRFNSLRAQFSF